jgi:hypothetical protein
MKKKNILFTIYLNKEKLILTELFFIYITYILFLIIFKGFFYIYKENFFLFFFLLIFLYRIFFSKF